MIIWAGWNRMICGYLGKQWAMSIHWSSEFNIIQMNQWKHWGYCYFRQISLSESTFFFSSLLAKCASFSTLYEACCFLFFCVSVYCAFCSFTVHIRGQILRDDEWLLCILALIDVPENLTLFKIQLSLHVVYINLIASFLKQRESNCLE